jgi:hypothetical protein
MRKGLLISGALLLTVASAAPTNAGSREGSKTSSPPAQNPNPAQKPIPVSGSSKRTPTGVEFYIHGGRTKPPRRGYRIKAVNTSCPGYTVVWKGIVVIGRGTDANGKPNQENGLFIYTCSDDDVPHLSSGCVANCPPGVAQWYYPPDPRAIVAWAEALSIAPLGKFAPPVERPDVEAITGLRLYSMVTPETFRPVTASRTEPGDYFATATATPGNVTLEANNKEQDCGPGPAPDPSTPQGRADSPCYVEITDVPDGGNDTAGLTVEWTIEVTSNIPGILNDTWTIERTTDLPIKIKELQAVVEAT